MEDGEYAYMQDKLDKKDATITRLTAERDALREACEVIAGDASSCSCPPRRIDPAHGEHCHHRIARAAIVRTLRAALDIHGEHLLGCSYHAPSATPCNCGLDAALAEGEEILRRLDHE